mmetsp:Transcript_76598/g.175624  ORF Transcript_76598/g.175624 Transcript_76598/m.175624 type:complete len:339 (+) Transcript_76598:126-1142(+)
MGLLRIWAAVVALVTAETYLVFSIPTLKQLAYAKASDGIVRVLVMDKLDDPRAIAVDADRGRMFVADGGQGMIFWYQLIRLPTGKLICDGRQHVAASGIAANMLTVDEQGNLFYTGKLTAELPIPPEEVVWMIPVSNLNAGMTEGALELYNPLNSAAGPGQPPRVNQPNGVATDGTTIFWGNRAGAQKSGGVVKAKVAPPSLGETTCTAMTDREVTGGIALTARHIFYAVEGSIYGISQEKATSTCHLEGECVLVADQFQKVNQILWDGDGTMYVSDAETGIVFQLPAGVLQKIRATKFIEVAGVYSIDIFSAGEGSSALGSSSLVALVLGVFALGRM